MAEPTPPPTPLFGSYTAKAEDPPTPGQLLLTEGNLLALREKLLSVFDVASILSNENLPWYRLQRDIIDLDPFRAPPGPLPGNDFHQENQITPDPSAWAAQLQFHAADRNPAKHGYDYLPLLVQLTHIREQPGPQLEAQHNIEEAAELIRSLWPDSTIGWPKYRQLGPSLIDPSAPEYHMFHWLASKELNQEAVSLDLLPFRLNGRYAESRDKSVGDNLNFETSIALVCCSSEKQRKRFD